MMDTLTILDNLRVATPCPIAWEAMPGDDRIRSCSTCAMRVYNLSDMTTTDALTLVREAEGRLCVRFYRRADGTILTADCPVGVRAATWKRLRRLASAGVLVFVAVRSSLWIASEGRNWLASDGNQTPSRVTSTFASWVDRAARAIGLDPPGGAVVGAICPVPVPPRANAPAPSGPGSAFVPPPGP